MSDDDIGGRLDEFTANAPGVTHALVLSSDGLVLGASSAVDADRAEQLAAIASGLLSLGHHGADLFDKGRCEQVMLRLSRGHLLFVDITERAGLAVLTGPDADLRTVAYEMTAFADRAAERFAPQARGEHRRPA